MIDIRVRAEALLAKLNRIGGGMRPTLGKAMEKGVLYVHSRVPKYPKATGAPGRDAQGRFTAAGSYRRTGTLGRTVTSMQGLAPEALSRVDNLGGQVVGIVGTALSYAPWVIDEERQAKQHRGRWWTLQRVVQDARNGIKNIFEQAIKDLIR